MKFSAYLNEICTHAYYYIADDSNMLIKSESNCRLFFACTHNAPFQLKKKKILNQIFKNFEEQNKYFRCFVHVGH